MTFDSHSSNLTPIGQTTEAQSEINQSAQLIDVCCYIGKDGDGLHPTHTFPATSPATPPMKNGHCANPSLQPDFDPSRYLGDWYEIYRSKTIRFEKGHDIVARYGSDPKHPERITVTNLQTLDGGKMDTITGYAVRRSADGPAADLRVRFNCLLRGSYKVVETDYETYSVVYSSRCLLFGLIRKEYCWILGRKRDMANDTELLNRLFVLINDQTGMTRDDFLQSPQTEQ